MEEEPFVIEMKYSSAALVNCCHLFREILNFVGMSVPSFAGLTRSRLVNTASTVIAISAVVVTLLVFEPPKDVEARVGRPFLSSVYPCSESELFTVDVADKRYISRVDVFSKTSTALPEVRVQSVEDNGGNVYVLKTELITGKTETIVLDPDGFPIVSSASGDSEPQQLLWNVEIDQFASNSEPVLVPVNSGFYLFAQLTTGATRVFRIGLNSSGNQILAPE